MLATCSHGGIHIWDFAAIMDESVAQIAPVLGDAAVASNPKLIAKIASSAGTLNCVRWSKDGRLACAEDSKVLIWACDEHAVWKCIQRYFLPFLMFILSLEFSHHDRSLLCEPDATGKNIPTDVMHLEW